MNIEALKNNTKQIKEIIREMYVFTNQLEIIKNLETSSEIAINTKEKILLSNAINALKNQLIILTNTVPELVGGPGFYQKLLPSTPQAGAQTSVQTRAQVGVQSKSPIVPAKKLIQVKYKPHPSKEEKVSLTINDKDRKTFLENLSKSNLSINQLKTKYAVEKPVSTIFGKPHKYAKLSNHFFKKLSNRLIAKGYFKSLNRNLRKMNSPFVLGTYLSISFFTILISFFIGLFLFIFLLFFNMSLTFPFISFVEKGLLLRFFEIFWIVFAIPLSMGLLMYFYPFSEGRNLGEKINQELPFVAIHMSAIATSGVEPMSIFKIILKNEEYKYTSIEFKKLMNLINFHGNDLITALKKTAKSSSSSKLKDLLGGLATTITSGGDMHEFLDKHAETMLFDYRLEREKYTKTSETFMDIYISIAIAAPMILLMLFVIMGSTGALTSFLGLSVEILSILLILIIILLNIGFLIFLKMKQPVM